MSENPFTLDVPVSEKYKVALLDKFIVVEINYMATAGAGLETRIRLIKEKDFIGNYWKGDAVWQPVHELSGKVVNMEGHILLSGHPYVISLRRAKITGVDELTNTVKFLVDNINLQGTSI
jgi:hypothetical protein